MFKYSIIENAAEEIQKTRVKNVELISKKFNVLAIPLDIKFSRGYNNNNMVETKEKSSDCFEIDLKELMQLMMFDKKTLRPQFSSYNIKRSGLKAFMEKCILYSMIVQSTMNSFPISVELMFSQTQTPFVIPYEEGSRSNVVSEVEKCAKIKNEVKPKPFDLIRNHGVCMGEDLNTVELLQSRKDILSLLGKEGEKGVTEEGKPYQKHPNRTVFFEGCKRPSVEYVYLEKNIVYYPLLRKCVEKYMEQFKCETQNAITNFENLTQSILNHSEDNDIWRVELNLLRDAFAYCFVPIERFQDWCEQNAGLKDIMYVQLRGFDARAHKTYYSLSSILSINRFCAFRVVLYIVLPWT
jgi:hypothetical protein